MTESLRGTVALVTGASSGIGEATARAPAGHGAAVALVARRKDRLDVVASEITQGGGRAVALGLDITRPEEAVASVDRPAAELGRLDTVVDNAGVMLLGPALDASLEAWERMVDLDVKALLGREAAPPAGQLTVASDRWRR
jgi:NADP-dependent 3-hydroxy acid dehydrogenase YdfG